jgi:hypothetical protein
LVSDGSRIALKNRFFPSRGEIHKLFTVENHRFSTFSTTFSTGKSWDFQKAPVYADFQNKNVWKTWGKS